MSNIPNSPQTTTSVFNTVDEKDERLRANVEFQIALLAKEMTSVEAGLQPTGADNLRATLQLAKEFIREKKTTFAELALQNVQPAHRKQISFKVATLRLAALKNDRQAVLDAIAELENARPNPPHIERAIRRARVEFQVGDLLPYFEERWGTPSGGIEGIFQLIDKKIDQEKPVNENLLKWLWQNSVSKGISFDDYAKQANWSCKTQRHFRYGRWFQLIDATLYSFRKDGV